MKMLIRPFAVRVALAFFCLYLLTLSHGVTVNSAGLTAEVAGWTWQPLLGHPLLWLLTLPLRLIPGAWTAVGLNLFTAACAAITLGLLARSVEVLPWSRSLPTLPGWQPRWPALLAVVLCGLEFSFWQEATAATGEMFDVLLLAAAIWCMLEHRAGKNSRWLYAASFFWGCGMAENWAMQLTLPLFVGGLVWQRKRRFFKLGFFLTTAGWGLAGFSIYALMPLVNGLLPGAPWDFGTACLNSLKETKYLLRGVYGQFWLAHRLMGVTAMLFFLLPVIACVARLRDENIANKFGTDKLQIWLFRVLRAALLIICVWLAFDPLVGLRKLLAEQMGVTLPLLSFDYLNGLGGGFLAGNLLMLPRAAKRKRHRHFGKQIEKWLERGAASGVMFLLTVAAVGLLLRNGPVIGSVNRQSLGQFGGLALRSLPAGGGIVLGDSPEKLVAFQAAQAEQAGGKTRWLAVDARALPSAEYRQYLDRLRSGVWLTPTNHHDLTPRGVLHLLKDLDSTNRVFYLHPAFGIIFEAFYLHPEGAVYELKSFPDDVIPPPPLTADTVARTEKIWDEFLPRIAPLEHAETSASAPARFLKKKFQLGEVNSRQAALLGEWYSMALNGWGVELQRNGHLPQAQIRFSQALRFNPDNWIARVNLYCNTNLQAGTKVDPANVGNLSAQLGSAQHLAGYLDRLGPLDEPALCYLLGTIYEQDGLPRQAIQQFGRAQALAHDFMGPQLALARLYNQVRMSDAALQTVRQMRAGSTNLVDQPELDLQLSLLAADAWFAKTNRSAASQVLKELVHRHPQNLTILNRIAQAFVAVNDQADADQVIAKTLALAPGDWDALVSQSDLLIQNQRPLAAIPLLDKILAATNHLGARFNRALAYQRTQNYAAAKMDYLALQEFGVNPAVINFGLGEIATHERETNQAIRYFSLCLSNIPPGSALWNTVHQRMRSLDATNQ